MNKQDISIRKRLVEKGGMWLRSHELLTGKKIWIEVYANHNYYYNMSDLYNKKVLIVLRPLPIVYP